MKLKKEKLYITIIVILLVLIAIVGLIVYGGKIIKIDSDEDYINIIALPEDNDFEDNKKLYGEWNSRILKIFENNEEISSNDLTDKSILITDDKMIRICYRENDEFICENTEYSYVNDILYIEKDSMFLSNEQEVSFEDDYLILKSKINDTKYSALYFLNE